MDANFEVRSQSRPISSSHRRVLETFLIIIQRWSWSLDYIQFDDDGLKEFLTLLFPRLLRRCYHCRTMRQFRSLSRKMISTEGTMNEIDPCQTRRNRRNN